MDQFDRMLAKYQPVALSLFRFITGLLLFQYGVAKILKFPVIPDGNAYAFLSKVQLMSLSGAAGTIELILGALLLLGLFTRPVAFILAGEMAFAYFMGHAPEEFLSAHQRRHARDRVLLRLPLSLDGRRRPDQPRCDDAEEVVKGYSTGHSGMVRRTRPGSRDSGFALTRVPMTLNSSRHLHIERHGRFIF